MVIICSNSAVLGWRLRRRNQDLKLLHAQLFAVLRRHRTHRYDGDQHRSHYYGPNSPFHISSAWELPSSFYAHVGFRWVTQRVHLDSLMGELKMINADRKLTKVPLRMIRCGRIRCVHYNDAHADGGCGSCEIAPFELGNLRPTFGAAGAALSPYLPRIKRILEGPFSTG